SAGRARAVGTPRHARPRSSRRRSTSTSSRRSTRVCESRCRPTWIAGGRSSATDVSDVRRRYMDRWAGGYHLHRRVARYRLDDRLPNSVSPGKRVLLVRRPRGVVGVITPWNWPYTMPAELIAPALACGNAVVWTPASTTAVAGIALAECVAEADLPPGVFNLVTGPGSVVGDEIARNPGTHGVGFIGSTEAGRRVAEAAAGRAAVLELGGNGPVVVLEDADLDLAAEATVTACFMCAGQSCTAGERLL